MTEKDNLREKLHDKGKADEDLYIEAQEREKIRKLREAAGISSVVCPRDGTRLQIAREHGVTIDVCPTCRGIWLDEGELQSLLKQDEPAITRYLRSLLSR